MNRNVQKMRLRVYFGPVWCGIEVVWVLLGLFWVVWGVSMDRSRTMAPFGVLPMVPMVI